MPSAAAALAEQVFGDLAGRRVLLIGAGRIGELAAGSLSARGASIAYVVNRSPEAAASARDPLRRRAARRGTSSRRSSARSTSCSPRRARPSSSSAPRDVPSRRRQPLFFIDIAVPRDVDPAVHQLDGCYLYDIDDLEAVVAETLAGRRAGGGDAPSGSWSRRRRASASGRRRSRSCRRSPRCARAPRRSARPSSRSSATCSEDERRTIESVTAQILNKLLHLPTVRMKEAALAADGAAYAEAVRHLFGLEEKR